MPKRKPDGYIVTIDDEEGKFKVKLEDALECMEEIISGGDAREGDIDLYEVFRRDFNVEESIKVTLLDDC